MQDGSVTFERRKRGPDVWCFRWREGGPDGRRIHRRIVLGTADDLKGIASARKAVVGLRAGSHPQTRSQVIIGDSHGALVTLFEPR